MSRRWTAAATALARLVEAALIGVGKAQQNRGDVAGIQCGVESAYERRRVIEGGSDEIEAGDGALRIHCNVHILPRCRGNEI